MENPLITSTEVLALAFAPAEYEGPEAILPSRIETALLRFLQPVLGPLVDQLAESRYAEFTAVYIKPPLAYYVRSLVIADREAVVGPAGVVQWQTGYAKAAPAGPTARLARQARSDADTLLEKALRYIEAHPEEFPQYDSEQNIRRRILFKGGFVLETDPREKR